DNISGKRIRDTAKPAASSADAQKSEKPAVVRWAKYVELRITLQKNDKDTPIDESIRMYPPQLIIQYQQQMTSTVPRQTLVQGDIQEKMRYAEVEFRSTYTQELVRFWDVMMGLFIVHPKDPAFMRVDRDFCFLLAAYDIDPGTYMPRVMQMTDFNLWTWNSRVFPGIDPLVVNKGDRVRVRVGNLTMTNHPIHMHGYDFEVTGTDGGWVRPEARWPEVSIDIPVGAMRAYEFDAKYPGDWAIHCHKSHHTMNAMGHDVPTFIGADKSRLTKLIQKHQPEYMPMGTAGMADMGEMSMEIPANTVPMMTGWGPHGPIEMGGMFSVVKVREGIAPDDYADPGWYENPPGTEAYEWTGPVPDPVIRDSGETVLTPSPAAMRRP
ncbi:MAG: Copper resistance protein precursor, partial [Pseudomonadota bacterium]